MSTYENPDTTDEYWTWSPGSFTHRYGQEFKYDANGNITNQTRLDDSCNSAGLIDDLQYHYYPGPTALNTSPTAVRSTPQIIPRCRTKIQRITSMTDRAIW